MFFSRSSEKTFFLLTFHFRSFPIKTAFITQVRQKRQSSCISKLQYDGISARRVTGQSDKVQGKFHRYRHCDFWSRKRSSAGLIHHSEQIRPPSKRTETCGMPSIAIRFGRGRIWLFSGSYQTACSTPLWNSLVHIPIHSFTRTYIFYGNFCIKSFPNNCNLLDAMTTNTAALNLHLAFNFFKSCKFFSNFRSSRSAARRATWLNFMAWLICKNVFTMSLQCSAKSKYVEPSSLLQLCESVKSPYKVRRNLRVTWYE